ncbi:MAG: hypothetical protein AAB416_00330 [Patescibacteria group bacterium]
MEKIHPAIFVYILIVAVYSAIFLVSPLLGPTDDFVFLKTLQINKSLFYYSPDFPYYDSMATGRFTPLSDLEYNAVALFSNHPRAYFFFHAVQFILFAVFLWIVVRWSGLSRWRTLCTSIFLFLLPAFTISWFRLQLTDRNVIFYALLFIFFYSLFLNRQTIPLLLATLVAANATIYYKETAFILIGGVSIARIFLFWKGGTAREKALDTLLLASSITYLVFYKFLVLPYADLGLITHQSFNLLVFAKNLINYATFSDPFLFFAILPLGLHRIYRIALKHDSPHPLYDALLFAALCFMIAYLALGFYGPQYLLGAYAFAIPSAAFFISRMQAKKIIAPVILVLLIFAVNVIPAGAHYLTYNKYLPLNFNNMLDTLIPLIKESKNKPVSIFIDSVLDANTGGLGTYSIMAQFLEFRGLTNKDFDLRSATPRSTRFSSLKFDLHYSVFSPGLEKCQTGDILLLVPQAHVEYTQAVLDDLLKRYRLVWRSTSPYFVPLVTAKTLVKNVLANSPLSSLLVQDKNSFQYVDYYILQKK